MVGVEIIDPEQPEAIHLPRRLNGELARDIKRECFARGLILETGGRHGGVLRFLPPLVITEQEIDAALRILDSAISAAHRCRASQPIELSA